MIPQVILPIQQWYCILWFENISSRASSWESLHNSYLLLMLVADWLSLMPPLHLIDQYPEIKILVKRNETIFHRPSTLQMKINLNSQ